MKILIADDHAIVRDGLKMLISEAYPFAELDCVSDSADLLRQIHKTHFDLVLSDISMPPGDSGLEIIKKVRECSIGTRVLIVSMHSPDQYAIRAFKAGAMGYLNKSAAGEELVKAVNQILSGKRYISAEVVDVLAAAVTDTGIEDERQLSNRELEVFKLFASGKPVSEIANELMLSVNTISSFRSKVFEKMGFRNNLELIRYAVEHGLV